MALKPIYAQAEGSAGEVTDVWQQQLVFSCSRVRLGRMIAGDCRLQIAEAVASGRGILQRMRRLSPISPRCLLWCSQASGIGAVLRCCASEQERATSESEERACSADDEMESAAGDRERAKVPDLTCWWSGMMWRKVLASPGKLPLPLLPAFPH